MPLGLSLTAKERSEINAFVFSFGINSDEEKLSNDTDTFEQRAFRSAFALDTIINDWNELYHITTENELNAQIDIQTAIEEAEEKVKRAIAQKDSGKIKFAKNAVIIRHAKGDGGESPGES